jgi:hypothetical protein
VIVRDAKPEDFAEIERIHAAMGMDYQLPDLAHPLFLVRKVTLDDNGEVIGACFLRITAETYLWMSPDIAPRCKMDVMNKMQPEVLRAAWQNGLDDIEARIPETVERRFQKRLNQLGWSKNRSGWFPWTVATHA